MNRPSLFFLLALWLATSCSGDRPSSDLKTEDEKTYYAMGHIMGKKMARTEPSPQEMGAFLMGAYDGARTGAKPQVQVSKYQQKISEMFRQRMTRKVDEHKAKGKAHKESFLSQEGAKQTSSGLAYKIIRPGQGTPPKAQDTVKVDYRGTLIDGAQFDANDGAKFRLDRVIRGWTEGLQLISPGGEIQLVVPSDLGYGDIGSGPKIPGGATLVFYVTLHEVIPPPQPDKDKKKDKEKKN